MNYNDQYLKTRFCQLKNLKICYVKDMLYETVEMYENLPHFVHCITKYKKRTK